MFQRTDSKIRSIGQAQQLGLSTGEDRRPYRGMLLHHLELRRREGAGLEQDGIGHADLPDVVERGRLPDQLHLPLGQAHRFGDEACHLTHAPGVPAGLAATELRRVGEPLEGFELCSLEIAAAAAPG